MISEYDIQSILLLLTSIWIILVLFLWIRFFNLTSKWKRGKTLFRFSNIAIVMFCFLFLFGWIGKGFTVVFMIVALFHIGTVVGVLITIDIIIRLLK
jgi:hypothetical protein